MRSRSSLYARSAKSVDGSVAMARGDPTSRRRRACWRRRTWP